MMKKRMAPRIKKPFRGMPVELPTKKPNSSGAKILKPKTSDSFSAKILKPKTGNSSSVKILKPKTGVGVKETTKKRNISSKPKKPSITFEDSLKKYGNDVTKIPGWSSRNPDGKVKSKKKVKKK